MFSSKIYQITVKFPESEKYGLVSQMRRAAVSIPSNIAEGASRSSRIEFRRYLEIALGSAYELETQLLISKDLNLLHEKVVESMLREISEIIKLVSKLRSTL